MAEQHNPDLRSEAMDDLLEKSRSKASLIEEDAHQFLWAVSYSDLLMVLMSFFILFFQPDESQSVLNRVMLTLNQGRGPAAVGGSGNGGSAGIGAGHAHRTPPPEWIEPLAQQLTARNVLFAKDLKVGALIIDFEEDVYPPGEYALPSATRDRLQSVLQMIRPHADQVELVLVGHTDATPVARTRSRVMDSNLVLSNLRGARAVELAITLGFDPRWVSAQGAGEHARKTRSLSLRVMERRP